MHLFHMFEKQNAAIDRTQIFTRCKKKEEKNPNFDA